MNRVRYLVRDGSGRVSGMAAALALNSQDLTVMVRNMDTIFRDQGSALFASEGSSGGSPWAALSAPYEVRKRRAGIAVRRRNRLSLAATPASMERPVSQKILRWSENMMRSLTRAGHSEHVARSEGPQNRPRFILGTTNPLAHYHYAGSDNLPIRDPIARTAQQKLDLLEPARRYIVAKWQAVARSLRLTGREARR